MEKTVIELYNERELDALGKKLLRLRVIAAAVGLIALGFCVYFCATANSANAKMHYIYTVIASVLGGWAVISLRCFAINDVKAALRHVKTMLEGESETLFGSFTPTGERLFVKNGVAIRPVRCESEGRTQLLQLYDKKAELFDAGASRVRTVYGFITAYEV